MDNTLEKDKQQIEDQRGSAEVFLSQEAPSLGRLTGLDVDVTVGDGWTTDLQTGDITIDPKFFTDRGYTSQQSIYATLHELWAHVREIKREPETALRRIEFVQHNESDHFFDNIMTDITGNKYIHCVLPSMAEVATQLYDEKLFSLKDDDGIPMDYESEPLHLQFMYKMIRDEMIPGSNTPARPEVQEALRSLRDFNGTGDVIKYLTNPNSSLSGNDRFDMTLATIYPVYQRLLEQSRQEKENKQKDGDGDDSNDRSENSQTNDSPHQNEIGQKPNEQKPDPFEEDYKKYFEEKAPQPFSDEEIDKLNKEARDKAKENSQKDKPINPKRNLDKKYREETGFGLDDNIKYKNKLLNNVNAIDKMRDVYRSVISERVSKKRGLSKNSYDEGDILNPNRLAQAYADVASGVSDPEVFLRYESTKGRVEAIGNTDYIFVFDRSSSMAEDGKSEMAATCALILLEGLAAAERDIQQAEYEYKLDLDIDIRTALYVFNDVSTCVKPLGDSLTDRQRISVQKDILRTSSSTNDSLPLDDIFNIPLETDRQRIVVVVSDGESSEKQNTQKAIRQLRDIGVLIFGVGIGSNDTTGLYSPYAKRVDDLNNLPSVLQSFIEQAIK